MPDHFIPLTYGKKQENRDAPQKAHPEERPMSVGLFSAFKSNRAELQKSNASPDRLEERKPGGQAARLDHRVRIS